VAEFSKNLKTHGWTNKGLVIATQDGVYLGYAQGYPSPEPHQVNEATASANAQLWASAPELLEEICKLPCGECGHDLDRHVDKYGCEFDRGDREGYEGEPAQAMGPCGCKGGEYDKKLIALICRAKGLEAPRG
jgi:hypothetical protein